MYGLVNRGLEDMIRGTHGDDVWDEIKRRAGVDVEVFVRMDAYPDEVTYKLVGATVEVLGKSVESVLHAFGMHWTRYTGAEGYGPLLESAGASLPEFLANLDELHVRVGRMYPHLKPPSFRCSDVTADSLMLHYYSTRAGLAPMVVGLLEGLGERFGVEVVVEQVTDREHGDDHDSFRVVMR